MNGTGQRLIAGSLGRLLSLALTVGLSIVLTPFIIRHIGSSLFGLWSLIGGIMGFSGLLDLGLNSALKRFLPQAFEKQDQHLAGEIFCSAFSVFAGIGISIALGLGFGSEIIHGWIARETALSVFQSVWLVLVIDTTIQFPMRAWIGYFEARLRQDVLSGIETLKAMLRTGLIVYALSGGHGILALALATLTTNVIGSALLIGWYGFRYRDIRFRLAYIQWNTVLRLLDYSYKNLIAAIGDLLRFQIDLVVIASFCPLSYVAVYAIASRLSTYFMEAVSAFIGMSIPLFSQLDARGNPDVLKDVFYLLIKIASIVTIYIAGMFLILGKAFILRWLGEAFSGSYPVLVILTIGIGIALTQYPTVNLLRGLSLHTTVSLLHIVEGFANLGLSVWLVKPLGLSGVALGTAIPITIFAGIITPAIAMRSVDFLDSRNFVRVYGLVILKASVLMALFYGAVYQWIKPDFFRLGWALCLSTLYFPMVYAWGFSEEEKRQYLRIRERLGFLKSR